MIDEVQKLIDEYIDWLKDKTVLRKVSDTVEITTPYLDSHNDFIQIYVKKSGGQFIITDDGYTINDLKMSGCSLESHKRQNLLRVTLNGFGVQLGENQELVVSASNENFALKKHNLLQAILSVADLFYLAEPIVTSLFLEDVALWMDSKNIRYLPNTKFTGKSGLDHHFDFAIPKSRLQPERMIRTINRPNKEHAQNVAFSWIDTKEVRPLDSRIYAFLNDSERPITPQILTVLKSYEIQPIPWSKKEEFAEVLVA